MLKTISKFKTKAASLAVATSAMVYGSASLATVGYTGNLGDVAARVEGNLLPVLGTVFAGVAVAGVYMMVTGFLELRHSTTKEQRAEAATSPALKKVGIGTALVAVPTVTAVLFGMFFGSNNVVTDQQAIQNSAGAYGVSPLAD